MAEALELQRSRQTESMIGNLFRLMFGSIGSKIVMALTGLGLWVFIVAHLAGNLTVYAGPETFNTYAMKLHETPQLLWAVRIALFLGFPMHIFFAIRTAAFNRAARPVAYAYANKSRSTLAAKSMLLSGLVVLAFLLYHLAHFTWRLTGGATDAQTPYQMLVTGFQQYPIAILYIVAQVLLAMHLSHGLYSLFQHLGLWGRRWTPFVHVFALVVGYGLCLGFLSIPLSVMLGLIK